MKEEYFVRHSFTLFRNMLNGDVSVAVITENMNKKQVNWSVKADPKSEMVNQRHKGDPSICLPTEFPFRFPHRRIKRFSKSLSMCKWANAFPICHGSVVHKL
jgi:hypothetical protein